jgi:hypothetical protein
MGRLARTPHADIGVTFQGRRVDPENYFSDQQEVLELEPDHADTVSRHRAIAGDSNCDTVVQ